MADESRTTIAAIATGFSTASGISIVRISGPAAWQVADRIFKGEQGKGLMHQASHTVHHGWIVDGDEVIDEVLVMLMKGPKSYTGEDTAEINCHGGIYVTRRVLEVALANGATLAEPGEYTRRAFLNGKMDLTQAEAVGDLIEAQDEYARKSSVQHLRGDLKKKIADLRNKIIYETAYLESAIDDPEHYSLEGYREKLAGKVQELTGEIDHLLQTYEEGHLIREGIRTVILGKPNAGKSSFLNALMGEDRAIVTEIAGTTRDLLREPIHVAGLTLQIADTAGIRKSKDPVEKIGVEKAVDEARDADLLLAVMDAAAPLDDNDTRVLKMLAGRTAIILLNKSDLETVVTRQDIEAAYFASNPAERETGEPFKIPVIPVSSKNLTGIDEFKQTLENLFFAGNLAFNDEVYITNTRHKVALTEAKEALTRVQESIKSGVPEDFFTIDLMDAYQALGRITGETLEDDLTDEIFKNFCMGK